VEAKFAKPLKHRNGIGTVPECPLTIVVPAARLTPFRKEVPPGVALVPLDIPVSVLYIGYTVYTRQSEQRGAGMSASGTSIEERADAGGMAGVLAGAFWLAKREVRRAWTSYPLTGVLLMLMGFYVAPSVPGVFEFDGPGTAGERMEGFYNAFFSDCLFVVACAFLAATIVSGESAPARRSFLLRPAHPEAPGGPCGERGREPRAPDAVGSHPERSCGIFAGVYVHRSRGAWCDLPLVLRGLDRLRPPGIGAAAPPRAHGRG
jgi:hypothetical protein